MKGVSSNQQKLNDTYLEGKVKKKKNPQTSDWNVL